VTYPPVVQAAGAMPFVHFCSQKHCNPSVIASRSWDSTLANPSSNPHRNYQFKKLPAVFIRSFFGRHRRCWGRSKAIYAYKLKPSSFGLALLHRFRQSGPKTPVFLDIDDWELSWHGGDDFCYRPTPRQLYRDLFKSESALRNPDDPFYIQQIERFVPKANHVTTHNAFLRNRFGGTYVPNGKDVCLFNPEHYDGEASRDRFNLTGYRILMFPGAPRPYKGVEDILAALDILDQPDLRLVIVGGSPYDEYDQQLTARWGHRIIKLPRTPYGQMPEVISAAHAIVVPQQDNPATQAQFPLKLTDGMAMAKPILATRVGDVPEILGEAGYLVDSNSPQQLADGICKLFSEFDTAQAKGQQARQRCIDHYSIESMAKTLAQILPQSQS
jgi:glycosyltransferase involved in cell wall biosynthesis